MPLPAAKLAKRDLRSGKNSSAAPFQIFTDENSTEPTARPAMKKPLQARTEGIASMNPQKQISSFVPGGIVPLRAHNNLVQGKSFPLPVYDKTAQPRPTMVPVEIKPATSLAITNNSSMPIQILMSQENVLSIQHHTKPGPGFTVFCDESKRPTVLAAGDQPSTSRQTQPLVNKTKAGHKKSAAPSTITFEYGSCAPSEGNDSIDAALTKIRNATAAVPLSALVRPSIHEKKPIAVAKTATNPIWQHDGKHQPLSSLECAGIGLSTKASTAFAPVGGPLRKGAKPTDTTTSSNLIREGRKVLAPIEVPAQPEVIVDLEEGIEDVPRPGTFEEFFGKRMEAVDELMADDDDNVDDDSDSDFDPLSDSCIKRMHDDIKNGKIRFDDTSSDEDNYVNSDDDDDDDDASSCVPLSSNTSNASAGPDADRPELDGLRERIQAEMEQQQRLRQENIGDENTLMDYESAVAGGAAAAPQLKHPDAESNSVYHSLSTLPTTSDALYFTPKQSLSDKEAYRDLILTCPTYSSDIYVYNRKRERLHRSSPKYMTKQRGLTSGMRTILVDWLVEVQEEYELREETLFLSVALLDRFMSTMKVARQKLQLVGIGCMFIAAKYEEVFPPSAAQMTFITDETYTVEQLRRMERLILSSLGFTVSVPTINCFLQYFLKVCRAERETIFYAQFICELCMLEVKYLPFLPSELAAAAVCLANMSTGMIAWSEVIETASGYSVPDFHDLMRQMLVSLADPVARTGEVELQAVFDKYATSRYLEVSKTVTPPSELPPLSPVSN